ncbi:MAG: VOC family protein [Chloroflexi bacterium]|nr:VOC family protein [Chloroflexota bacterium]
MSANNFSPKDIFSQCVQIGVVVKDLDQRMKALTEIFGIGPFRVVNWPPPGRDDMQRQYYGQPGDFTARMAFTELGTVELELIEPGEGQSIWADFLRDHGEGIHHIRFNTFDMAPVINYLGECGVGISQSGLGIRVGTSWANFDTEDKVGFTVELMKAVAGTDGRTPKIVEGNVLD